MSTTDRWGTEDMKSIRRGEHMVIERARTAHLANHLSSVALRQWERTLTGMVAFPAAVALGIAATATYCVAILERGFEVFEASIGEVADSVSHERVDGNNGARGEQRPEARA
jgi:predicted ATPase